MSIHMDTPRKERFTVEADPAAVAAALSMARTCMFAKFNEMNRGPEHERTVDLSTQRDMLDAINRIHDQFVRQSRPNIQHVY